MKKILLYINTLTNLSSKQVFFLFYNKLIKKYFIDDFTIKKIKKQNPIGKTLFVDIKSNINSLIGNNIIWDLGIEKKKSHLEYFDNLKTNVLQFIRNNDLIPIINLWTIETGDAEVNHNYQRFYLFNEVFKELEMSDEKKIQIIIEWTNNNCNNKLTWTGFNCAIRLINWIKILSEMNEKNITNSDWGIVEKSIFQQFKFNMANVEHHIPGNHVLFQYYSGWLISVIFHKWVSSSEEEIVLNNLLNEISNEFLPSGLHFELSSHYHLQIMLVVLYMFLHLKNTKKKVPDNLIDITKKGLIVIDKFLMGNYYPEIGDSCYNFFHESKLQDLQNIEYLRKQLLEFSVTANDLINIDDIYLVHENKNFKMIFDVGKIGLKNNSGHGHADILSFLLSYNKSPIFIDPGTRQYSSSTENLKLKKSSHHNTISVNNSDQAKLWGFFRWAYLPKDISFSFNVTSENSYELEGMFTGFQMLGGVKHRRMIEIRTDEIIINDELIGKKMETIQINFILHPDVKIELKKKNVRIILEEKLFVMKTFSRVQPKIELVEQEVYDSYNTSISSIKLQYVFNIPKTTIFQSKIVLKIVD